MRILLSCLCSMCLVSCHGPFVPAPAGRVEPPRPYDAIEYRNETASTVAGVTATGDELQRSASARIGRDAFRTRVAHVGSPRMLVYFNTRIAPPEREWRSESRGVIEVAGTDSASLGLTTSRRRMIVQQESRTAPEQSSYALNEATAAEAERLVTRTLLDANATLMDRNLLLRLTAPRVLSGALSDVEIKALQSDVDLVIEVTFAAGGRATDDVSMQLRAIRTSNAQVVGLVSSADDAPTSVTRVIAAAPGRGYEETDTVVQHPFGASVQQAVDRLLARLALHSGP